ncbi:MAG: response regulator [Lachnospiraceae bacterium]|nr:response regulator [Lachnospiraceae bacterium]
MEKDIISILIIDDEKYEGILMAKSVEWDRHGFRIMATVQSAAEALKIMERELPDLVYTDINMPMMDGLELSKRIREAYPSVHIVIVTGYREFEYAREAIHIGVEDFLLKPILTDELIATAEKAKQAILKSKKEELKQKENLPVLCQELVRRIVRGDISEKDAEEKLSAYNMLFLHKNKVRGIFIKVDGVEKIFTSSVLEVMNSMTGGRYWYTFLDKDIIFFIIEEKENIKEEIELAFLKMTKVNNDSIRVMSVSHCCKGITDCTRMLSECEEAALNIIRDKSKILIFYEDYIGLMLHIKRSCPVNFDEYRIAVKGGDLEAAVAIIDQYLKKYVYDGPMMISQLRNLGGLILHNSLSILKEYNKYLDDSEQMELFTAISNINTLHEFCRIFYSFIEKVIEIISENHVGNSIVLTAQEYIAENLGKEGLSLNRIASDLFVNSSYLSRIFKQVTGESLTKYIMRKRMEKSMDLFDNTHLKVYEVAAAVGMPDAHYFGTCFKKYTGKTVNQYKSKNRNLLGE